MFDSTENQRQLTEIESSELIDRAGKVAGFDLARNPTFASAANLSGIRNDTLAFSQRRDSRTIFAHDTRYGYRRQLEAWRGSSRTATAACRRVLGAAGIPAKEIAEIQVVSEYGAVAERRTEHDVRVERPELLRKLARAQRAVDGLPVWSSYGMVGLTGDGRVGQLELHWPWLSPEVLKEANVLRTIVQRGFQPGRVPGARVESIEAGIIHSPAMGFFMDVIAAIRVIYHADDPRVGRKPTVHLDRHGEFIERPRDIQPTPPVETGRGAPRGEQGRSQE